MITIAALTETIRAGDVDTVIGAFTDNDRTARYQHFIANVELTAFESAVTDWELRRGFERL